MTALLKGQEPNVDVMSRTVVPFSPDYEQDEEHLLIAASVLQNIIRDITKRFPELVPSLPAEDSSYLYISCLERVYLALLQHPNDPTTVIRHFLLSFSRSRSTRLAALPIADRKMAYRVWEGFVRAVL